MSYSARDAYQEAQVLTATPMKLRLMLIDGALRYAHETREKLEQNESESAAIALTRCQNIVAELLSSAYHSESEIGNRVAALYAFILRSLVNTQMAQEVQPLRDAIRILEVERETWSQLCEKFPDAGNSPQEAAEPLETSPTSGFSLEA